MTDRLLTESGEPLQLQAPSTFMLLESGTATSYIDAISAAHVRPVWMFRFDFDTPLYVHTGIGNLVDTFASPNITYIGAGAAGSISSLQKSDQFTPQPIQLSLSGVNDSYLTEAIDAGNYGDRVTIYRAYKDANGDLVDAPLVISGGYYEKADITLGDYYSVTVSVQHILKVLSERDGRRFTDEDQENEFSGDTGCSFMADMVNKKLVFGGQLQAVAGILANFVKKKTNDD